MIVILTLASLYLAVFGLSAGYFHRRCVFDQKRKYDLPPDKRPNIGMAFVWPFTWLFLAGKRLSQPRTQRVPTPEDTTTSGGGPTTPTGVAS